jgi:hypothetical protein
MTNSRTLKQIGSLLSDAALKTHGNGLGSRTRPENVSKRSRQTMRLDQSAPETIRIPNFPREPMNVCATDASGNKAKKSRFVAGGGAAHKSCMR